jgi:plastocyanin
MQRRPSWFALGALVALLAALVSAAPAQAATIHSHNRPSVGDYPSTTTHHTWYLWVGAESMDHAIQGTVFLPRQVWIDVGDTIVWTSYSADIHTVTFLQAGQSRPQFNPSDPMQSRRYGGYDYDGHSYYNSGLLSTMTGMTRSYSLRFTTPGVFSYLCLVHTLMYGVVYVRPAGTPYPYSQADYNQQIAGAQYQIDGEGAYLINQAERDASQHFVYAGFGSPDGVSIMRFINSTIYIYAGQTVTFMNADPQMVHTVTFGYRSGNPMSVYGNPYAFDGRSPLSSGYLYPGTIFRVTFTRPGTYYYRCLLHYFMGMYGTVVVLGGNGYSSGGTGYGTTGSGGSGYGGY